MGSEASSLMTKYFKKMKQDPSMAGDVQGQKKLFKKIFHALDKDGNGFIEGKEISGLVKELSKAVTEVRKRPLSENEIRSILKVADRNNDGRIDWGEFCGLMFSVSSIVI
mmetsp:Transcript_15272/g.26013  ORF Transcript_15272/g.26013 Transcript_15272/m.26013 type:complete len:110 (-) Transcript_15272:56-385(-)